MAVNLEPVGIKPARIQIDPVTMRPTDRDGKQALSPDKGLTSSIAPSLP